MKWYAAALALAFLLLQYRLWFSADGVGEAMQLRQAVAAQRADNDQRSARNRQLAAEVRDLKQGNAAIEERARNDLGMVGANETFYQMRPLEAPVAAPVAAPGASPASAPGAAPELRLARPPASPAEGDSLTRALPR
jgi:cell division protein FtsB